MFINFRMIRKIKNKNKDKDRDRDMDSESSSNNKQWKDQPPKKKEEGDFSGINK